jgi:hypothetical protein
MTTMHFYSFIIEIQKITPSVSCFVYDAHVMMGSTSFGFSSFSFTGSGLKYSTTIKSLGFCLFRHTMLKVWRNEKAT